MPAYIDRLHEAIRRTATPALVGIDPRYRMLPEPLIQAAESRGLGPCETQAWAFEEFGKRLVDVVAPLVPAVKPQAAFFEQLGPAGVSALQRVIAYAREAGLIVICDAKRGDIGSTAQAYAEAYLAGTDPQAAPFAADALTVNPYLGTDSLEPFCKVATERGAGIYVLVRTSNPGARDFQDLESGGLRLYETVANVIEQLAAANPGRDGMGSIGAVVGATYPQELSELRQRMPSVPLLVPGYGSQGGGAEDVAGAFRADGLGALVNSSRGINFAYRSEAYAERYTPDQWEAACEAATREMVSDLGGVCVVDRNEPSTD